MLSGVSKVRYFIHPFPSSLKLSLNRSCSAASQADCHDTTSSPLSYTNMSPLHLHIMTGLVNVSYTILHHRGLKPTV